MVIILQQTSDNGNKFISTVVDTPQDSSFNSSFSLNSQLSISERSAAYKQRIDSLFGRTSRVSSFNPNGEPFRIRIDGKSLTPTKGLMGSHQTPSTTTAPSTVTLREENEGRILSTSEDDEYSRINDKGSVIADSLNHQVKVSSKKGNGIVSGSNNISSVRITCEDSESSGSQLQSLVLSSSGEEALGRIETNLDPIMWRNSNYGETSSPAAGVGSPAHKPFSTVRCSPGGMLKFSVEYLGSVPVRGNTAALQDLQAPLRSLYMHYLSSKNMMTGQLAITSDGLRFEAPKVRLVNPFTTIAVWAAVKFVGRGDPVPTECAFMPLISDPEGQDKSRLFGKMDTELSSVYQNCITDSAKNFKNPPIFACVMREASFSLDCHAFACKCAEDAIVIAANLYQSLVDKMRSGKEGESGYGSLTRGSPTTQSSMNQNRSSSSASSTPGPSKAVDKTPVTCLKTILTQVPSSSSTQNECRAVFSDSESIVPVRPPRKKKKASEIPAGNLKRYNSDDSVLLNLPYRRRSFKAGYQGHYIKNKKRVQIHTPDESSSGDFSDSVDQVLDRIVNPCGMSFNDLKPAYQELILKIALTLTQDQLYKKSKQAMKKQQLQQKPGKKPKSSPSSAEASDDNSQFVNQFLKSISKITSSGKAVGNLKQRSPTKPPPIAPRMGSRQKQQQKILTKIQKTSPPTKAILKKTKEDEVPFMSFCSGCVCDNCSDKCYCSLPSKQVPGAGGMPPTPTSSNVTGASTPIHHPACSSNAETDVPRTKKTCGYDTDSCAESEKCYCSLQRVKSNGLKIYNINLDTETSDTDTNSYDLEPFNNPKMSDMHAESVCGQSQRPVEILSYHPSRRLSYCFSPTTSKSSYMKNISPSAHSSESEKRRDKLNQSYTKNVSKKFRDLNVMESTQLSSKKVLLITGSNASGQVVYKDSPFNFRQGLDFGDGLARRIDPSKIVSKPGHFTPDTKVHSESPSCNSNASTPEAKAGFAPEKVLSMKKAAEIAAMFTDLNLNQAADFNLTNNSDTEDTHTRHQEPTSIDFETSLGYLP